jgi:hypothetical protein
MPCPSCGAEPLNQDARFCSKCGAGLPTRRSKAVIIVRLIAFPFVLFLRVLAWPIERRRERLRWLSEASGPDSPINRVPGLSDGAKRVYTYLASVTLRFGSSHSRIRTIAHAARLSEHRARLAIRELARRGLVSHKRRTAWHGRGARAYFIK